MNHERDELIKTMVRTFLEKSERQAYSDHRIDLDAMAAVLDLCIEELLRDPNAVEFDRAIENTAYDAEPTYRPSGRLHPFALIRAILYLRRARYAPPKPKTAQEKIEAILDAHFLGSGTNSEIAAEIISELKQTEQR